MGISGKMRQAVHRVAQKYRDQENARTMRRAFEEALARVGARATWEDFLQARRQTGCNVREYFLFHFYERTPEERDTFLTTARRDAMIHYIGDDETINCSAPGNKILFNALFGEFLCREWLNPTAASPEAFAAFVQRHGRVIVKPACDGQGKGIFTYAYEGDEAAKALHETLAGKAMLDGTEPDEKDIKAFSDLLQGRQTNLLINNPQQSAQTDATLTQAAHKASIPVIDITEQMPKDCKDLTSWIDTLSESIISKVSQEQEHEAASSPSPSVGTQQETPATK